MYVATFKNAGTAQNYVSHIAWACRAFRFDMSWYGDGLRETLKGLKKRTTRLYGGPARTSRLWTQKEMVALISVAIELISIRFAKALSIWRCALLRVQSEGIQLEIGNSKYLYDLPYGRHSAVWVQADVLHIRLARRKHRPDGSLLRIPCCCSRDEFCPVHFATDVFALPDGTKIIDMSPHSAMNTVKRIAGLLGLPHIDAVGWKAWRAGRATAMANDGCTISSILLAGEWRSHAFARYVDESAIDPKLLLGSTLDASDEE